MSEFQFFEYNGKQLPCFRNERSSMWLVPLCVFQNMIAPEGDTEVIENELETIFPNTYKMKAEEMKEMKAFLDNKTKSSENDFEPLHGKEKTIKLAAPLALLKQNKYFDTSNPKEYNTKPRTSYLTNSNNNYDFKCQDQDHPTQIPKVSSSSKNYSGNDTHRKTSKDYSGRSFYHPTSPQRSSCNSRQNLNISSCSDDTFSESEYSDKYYRKIVMRRKRRHHSKDKLPKSFVSNDSHSRLRGTERYQLRGCVFEHVMEDFDQKVLSQSSKEHHQYHPRDRHSREFRRRSPEYVNSHRSRSRSKEYEYNNSNPYYRKSPPFEHYQKDRYFRPYRDRIFYDNHRDRPYERFGNNKPYYYDRHFNNTHRSRKRYIPIKRDRDNIRKRSCSSKSKSPKPAKPQKDLPRIAGEKSALISATTSQKSNEKPSTEIAMKVDQVPNSITDLVKMIRHKSNTQVSEKGTEIKSQNLSKSESSSDKTVILDKAKMSKESPITEEAIKKKSESVKHEPSVASNRRSVSSNSTAKSDTTIDSGIDEKCDDVIIKEKSIKVDSFQFNRNTGTKWPYEKSLQNIDPFSSFPTAAFFELLSTPNIQPITSVTDKVRNEVEFVNFNSQFESPESSLSHDDAMPQVPSTLKNDSSEYQSIKRNSLSMDVTMNPLVEPSYSSINLPSSIKSETGLIHSNHNSSEQNESMKESGQLLNRINQPKEIGELKKDLPKQPLSWKKALLEKAKQNHVLNTSVKNLVSQGNTDIKSSALEEHTLTNKTSFEKKSPIDKVAKESLNTKESMNDCDTEVITTPSTVSIPKDDILLQNIDITQKQSRKDVFKSPTFHNSNKPGDDISSTPNNSNLPLNSCSDLVLNDINTINREKNIKEYIHIMKNKLESLTSSAANEKIGNKTIHQQNSTDCNNIIDNETPVETDSNKSEIVQSKEPLVKLPISVENNLSKIIVLQQNNHFYHGIMEIDMKAPVLHFLKYLHPGDKRTQLTDVMFSKRRIPYVQIKNQSIMKNMNFLWRHGATLVRVRDAAFVLKWSLMFICEQMRGLGIQCAPIENQFINDVYSSVYGRWTMADDVLVHCMGYTQPPILEADYFITLENFLNGLIPRMFELNFLISKSNLSNYVNVRTYQPINYLNIEVTKIFSKSFLYNFNLVREDIPFIGNTIKVVSSAKTVPPLNIVVLEKHPKPKKRKLSLEKKNTTQKKTKRSNSRNQSTDSSDTSQTPQLNQMTTMPSSSGMLTLGKQVSTGEPSTNVVAPSFTEFCKLYTPTSNLNVNNNSNNLDELQDAYQKSIHHNLQVNLHDIMLQKSVNGNWRVTNEGNYQIAEDVMLKTESVENEGFYGNSEEKSDNAELVIGSVYTLADSPVTTSEFFTNEELRQNNENNILDEDSSTIVAKLSNLKKVLVEAELAVHNVSDEKKIVKRKKYTNPSKEAKSSLSEVVKKLEQRVNKAP